MTFGISVEPATDIPNKTVVQATETPQLALLTQYDYTACTAALLPRVFNTTAIRISRILHQTKG